MFPVRMMLMYWSAVARLRNIPEPTVDATTLTYLPYCFFNLISPLMSILVAAIGYKIVRRK